jgi:hypothetical protein
MVLLNEKALKQLLQAFHAAAAMQSPYHQGYIYIYKPNYKFMLQIYGFQMAI